MARGETIWESFLTAAKRLPVKARIVMVLCLAVVTVELLSGALELRRSTIWASTYLSPVGAVLRKSREQRDISLQERFDEGGPSQVFSLEALSGKQDNGSEEKGAVRTEAFVLEESAQRIERRSVRDVRVQV